MTSTLTGTYTPRRRPMVHSYAESLPVRRGSYVLADAGVPLTGHVEGVAYAEGKAWFMVRYSNGVVGYALQGAGTVVAVDRDTHLVADQLNNVNRLCNVLGDAAANQPARCWLVVSAVSGGRYLVKHLDTNTVRVVGHRDMTNLY